MASFLTVCSYIANSQITWYRYPQSAEHVPSSFYDPGYIVDGLMVLVLLLAGGLAAGELIGGVKADLSDWKVNGG